MIIYKVGTEIKWSRDFFVTTDGYGVVIAAYDDRIIVKPNHSQNTVIVLFVCDNNIHIKELIETSYMRSMIAYDISTVYAPYQVIKGFTENEIPKNKN